MRLIFITALFFIGLLNTSMAQDQLELVEYLYKTYEKDKRSLPYRILYPANFDKSKSYPLLLFLHGRGESGTDNKKQLIHGAKYFLKNNEKYQGIIIFPQCPTTDYWANLSRPDKGGANRTFTFNTDQGPNPSLEMVIWLLQNLMAENYIDKKRIYLSGLSMGGFGSFELLWRMPNTFAACMPICGGGPPNKSKKMTDVPLWIFHGVKDNVVHPRYSVAITKAIQQAGGQAKITLYPEANHNSWDPAFAEPEFLSWMFSQSR